ncbi:MAG: CBS domain-containing protein, partial [Sphingobacterium sp.]
MYIGENISTLYTEIDPNATVAYTLDKINELHFHQLPVVKDKDFLGIISEEDLLSIDDESKFIKDVQINFPFIYTYDYQHILDALQLMEINQLDILPVLN